MRKVLVGVAGLVCVGLIALVCLPFVVDVDTFRPQLENELSRVLARKVTIGHLDASIFSGGAEATHITIADDPAFGTAPFLRAASLKLSIELWPLVSQRKFIVRGVTLSRPDVVLIENASGGWNFRTLGAGALEKSGTSTLSLSVHRVDIAGGRLSITKAGPKEKPVVLDPLNVTVHDVAASAAMPFTLSARFATGGDLEMSGNAGPIDSTDVSRTPFDGSAKASKVRLGNSGLLDPATPMDGLLGFNATIRSTGAAISSQGRIQLDQAKLARAGSPAKRPIEYDFAVDRDLARGDMRVLTGDLHIGKAAASVTGSIRPERGANRLDVRVAGNSMPVSELVEMLRPLDIVLPNGSSVQGGTADIRLAIEGLSSSPVSTGTVTVNRTRLAGFDLGSKLQNIAKLTGLKLSGNTDLEHFETSFRSGAEGTSMDRISAVAPAIGELSGAGMISPAHALDFKMRAVVHTEGTLLAALGRKSDASIPFFIRGTAANPEFHPDVAAIASKEMEKLPETVEKVKTFSDAIQGLFTKKPK